MQWCCSLSAPLRSSSSQSQGQDLRHVAHVAWKSFLQQMFLTNYLASTVPEIPLFLWCLPLGLWSPLFHIFVLVLTNLGHSSPSVKELSEPTSKTQRRAHTFSCHFQVQTSPLSCCGSLTGEKLYKVQQSVPFKCVLRKTDVACWPWWSHVVIYGNRPLRIFLEKLHESWFKPNLYLQVWLIPVWWTLSKLFHVCKDAFQKNEKRLADQRVLCLFCIVRQFH